MFQTTNQILNINVKGFGFSATPAFAMHVLESPKCVFTVEIIQLAHGLHTFWGKHGKRHQCHHGFGVIICYHHDHPPWGLRYLAVPVPLVPERGPMTCKWRIVSIRVSSQIWQIVRPNQSQLIPTDVNCQKLSKDTNWCQLSKIVKRYQGISNSKLVLTPLAFAKTSQASSGLPRSPKSRLRRRRQAGSQRRQWKRGGFAKDSNT